MKNLLLAVCVFVLFLVQCTPASAKKNPAKAPGYYAKALEYEESKDFIKARIEINKALEMDPDNPEYLLRKGLYLAMVGQVEEAVVWYKKSYKLKHDPAVAYSIAANLAILGKYADAEIYSILMAYKATDFIPNTKLLTEIELELWKLDRAQQCITALDEMEIDAVCFKKELKRRKSAKEKGSHLQMRGIKNHLYLKTGTITTGTSQEKGMEKDESVLTILNKELLADIIGYAVAVCRHFKVPVDIIIPAADKESAYAAEILGKVTGAVVVSDPADTIKGKHVWICVDNFISQKSIKELYASLKAKGKIPYIFSLAFPRSAARQCSTAPDITGLGGVVKFDAAALNKEAVVKRINTFLKNEADAYVKEQALFYSGHREHIRLIDTR
jgi:tetratricopeptide (TPR) repeat protein